MIVNTQNTKLTDWAQKADTISLRNIGLCINACIHYYYLVELKFGSYLVAEHTDTYHTKIAHHTAGKTTQTMNGALHNNEYNAKKR
jgi:hypothetical protein